MRSGAAHGTVINIDAAEMSSGEGIDAAEMSSGEVIDAAEMSSGEGIDAAEMSSGEGIDAAAMSSGEGIDAAEMSSGEGIDAAAMSENDLLAPPLSSLGARHAFSQAETGTAKNFVALQPLLSKIERVIIYETVSFIYIVGYDELEVNYRLLKVNRSVVNPSSLAQIMVVDKETYSKEELAEVLEMVSDGNRNTGGLTKMCEGFGIIGFIKFLGCYYINIITQQKKVGCIGSNNIYTIKANEIIPILPRDENESNTIQKLWSRISKKINQTSTDIAESRYMGLFQFVDITKDFYFSYTYDLTHSVQFNYIMSLKRLYLPPTPSEMYEWNYHQTAEFKLLYSESSSFNHWLLPIVHGSYEQRKFNLFGRTLDVALVARRSRHFAGTRYLKRGVSVHGKAANDVETEQILQLDSGKQAKYSSYLQMRASIPTYWHQEASVTTPKPPILINRVDPSYEATQGHFKDLIVRYGAPIIVLDLVKQYEKKPRESIIGKELYFAVMEINSTMPSDMQIRYCALDHSRITKTKQRVNGISKEANNGIGYAANYASTYNTGEETEWAVLENSVRAAAAANTQSPGGDTARTHSNTIAGAAGNSGNGRIDILKQLEDISAMTLSETAIFCTKTRFLADIKEFQPAHAAAARSRGYLEQRGVLRTNCIDCLDRTNAGQFAMALKFISISLRALGLTSESYVDQSSKLLLALMDMFAFMGDRIALQYGGSEAHKKMSFGRIESSATQSSHNSSSSELFTSIKRYYSNAFTDMMKQDAINLFLGYYIPSEKKIHLWDLDSDYELHNKFLRPKINEYYNYLFKELRRYNFFEDTRVSKNGSKIVERREHNIDDIEKMFTENSVDFETVFKNYRVKKSDCDNPMPTTNAIKRRILTSEKRKFISKFINEKADDYMHLWWKDALHEFYSQRQWMALPPPPGERFVARDYFYRSHNPTEMTFFDSVLGGNNDSVAALFIKETNNAKQEDLTRAAIDSAVGNNYNNSIDADHGKEKPGGENSKKRLSSSFNDSDPSLDKIHNSAIDSARYNFGGREFTDGGRPASPPLQHVSWSERSPEINRYSLQGSNSADNLQNIGIAKRLESSLAHQPSGSNTFQIGKYVREISLKARTLVGGLVFTNRSGGGNSGSGDYTLDNIDRANGDSNGMTDSDRYGIYSDFTDSEATSVYTKYASDYCDLTYISESNRIAFDEGTITTARAMIIDDKNSDTYRNFEQKLFDYNIGVDSVNEMEKLSVDSYINTTIRSGLYYGLDQQEDGRLTQYNLELKPLLHEHTDAELANSAITAYDTEELMLDSYEPATKSNQQPAGESSFVQAVVSKAYTGFSLVVPDLYSRNSNPHMIMNEVAVLAFLRANIVSSEV